MGLKLWMMGKVVLGPLGLVKSLEPHLIHLREWTIILVKAQGNMELRGCPSKDLHCNGPTFSEPSLPIFSFLDKTRWSPCFVPSCSLMPKLDAYDPRASRCCPSNGRTQAVKVELLFIEANRFRQLKK